MRVMKLPLTASTTDALAVSAFATEQAPPLGCRIELLRIRAGAKWLQQLERARIQHRDSIGGQIMLEWVAVEIGSAGATARNSAHRDIQVRAVVTQLQTARRLPTGTVLITRPASMSMTESVPEPSFET